MITKSVAGVAAGVLLIGGGAMATAQADPAPSEPTAPAPAATSPTATTQSDESEYPGSVFTTTSLGIRSSVEYRAENVARVVVSAGATDSKPSGSVTVTVDGESRSATLSRGVASVSLPRSLQPGSYTARAAYIPTAGSQYKRSNDSASFRVVKSGSATFVQAASVSLRERPTVRVQVEGDTGVTPRGSVTVVITDGRERHTDEAQLLNGQAVVRFPKVDRRGQWEARAYYGGSDVVAGSRGSDGFRVTR
jgi:hypothetical protein